MTHSCPTRRSSGLRLGHVGVGAAGEPSAGRPGDCRSRCAAGRGATAARGPTCRKPPGAVRAVSGNAPCQDRRSEEHTYELQSLMRISYAVFCLTKKNHIKSTPNLTSINLNK